MSSTKMTAFGAAVVSAMVIGASAATFQVDPAHTTVAFSIKHLGISEVHGAFTNFTGAIEYDAAKPEATKATGTILVPSIDTGNKMRDDHLRTPEFFDAAKFPEIKYEATSAEKVDGNWVVKGKLTMHGVTKEIAAKGELSGPVQDPWGKTRIGIAATATLDRQDYGVSYNKTLDKGGLMVANEVKIRLDIEAVQQ